MHSCFILFFLLVALLKKIKLCLTVMFAMNTFYLSFYFLRSYQKIMLDAMCICVKLFENYFTFFLNEMPVLNVIFACVAEVVSKLRRH